MLVRLIIIIHSADLTVRNTHHKRQRKKTRSCPTMSYCCFCVSVTLVHCCHILHTTVVLSLSQFSATILPACHILGKAAALPLNLSVNHASASHSCLEKDLVRVGDETEAAKDSCREEMSDLVESCRTNRF